jgi:hypothetical protein
MPVFVRNISLLEPETSLFHFFPDGKNSAQVALFKEQSGHLPYVKRYPFVLLIHDRVLLPES